MLPLAFLPLRRPYLWLGFVPAILGTILTTGYGPPTETTFQYVFYWVPFIYAGSSLVLAELGKNYGKRAMLAATGAVCFASLLSSLHWGAIFQRRTFASSWGVINLAPLTSEERQDLADLRELGALVPRDASIGLSERETPHFSNRITAYTLRVGMADADYLLFRKDSGNFGANQAQGAIRDGRYRLLAEKGKFILYQRSDVPPRAAPDL